jgi:hypothetical protein
MKISFEFEGWSIIGEYTPEQPEKINCLPEDATPGFDAEFEIHVCFSNELFKPLDVPQKEINLKSVEILDAATAHVMEGEY